MPDLQDESTEINSLCASVYEHAAYVTITSWPTIADLFCREQPGKGTDLVAALYCPCENKNSIWGEFWWKAEKDRHTWVFFDDDKTSETYGEAITHCPGCSKKLHRKTLLPA